MPQRVPEPAPATDPRLQGDAGRVRASGGALRLRNGGEIRAARGPGSARAGDCEPPARGSEGEAADRRDGVRAGAGRVAGA